MKPINTTQPIVEEPQFSINQWFNEHPIRIIGTPDEPFFYATDLAAILGIKRIDLVIKNFTERDIVSPGQREKYKLVTYKKYKDTMRKDQTILLLTERGAYKLIISSKSELAILFQDFIFNLIHTIRQSEREKLRVIVQNDMAALTAANIALTSKLQVYEYMIPIIYVFKKKINGNPYDFIPRSELESDYNPRVDNVLYGDDPVKTLYKMTCSPIAADFSAFTLYAEIFGVTEHVFIEISDDYCIPVNEATSKYNKYFIKKPDLDDISGIRIKYHGN